MERRRDLLVQRRVREQVAGDLLEGELVRGKLVAEPASSARKRYSMAELLKGQAEMKRLTAEVAWAHDGEPVGREIS